MERFLGAETGAASAGVDLFPARSEEKRDYGGGGRSGRGNVCSGRGNGCSGRGGACMTVVTPCTGSGVGSGGGSGGGSGVGSSGGGGAGGGGGSSPLLRRSGSSRV